MKCAIGPKAVQSQLSSQLIEVYFIWLYYLSFFLISIPFQIMVNIFHLFSREIYWNSCRKQARVQSKKMTSWDLLGKEIDLTKHLLRGLIQFFSFFFILTIHGYSKCHEQIIWLKGVFSCVKDQIKGWCVCNRTNNVIFVGFLFFLFFSKKCLFSQRTKDSLRWAMQLFTPYQR